MSEMPVSSSMARACPRQGPAVPSKTGVKTGQDSRSTRRRAALTMTIMDLSIHTTPLPHTDPEASLAFERVQASDAEVVQGPMEQYGGGPRLRIPRPRRQPGPHPGTALIG
jgi:hypothetical protein